MPPVAQAWASAGAHIWSGPLLTRTGVVGTSVGSNGCFSMQSSVVKRSVVIGDHKTSISLEDAFWASLKEIAASRQRTQSGLLTEINGHRQTANLSSATRLFVLQFFQNRAGQAQQKHP